MPSNPISAQQVQGNFIAYFRLFADLPNIAFIEKDGLTWTASPEGPGYMVLSAQLAATEADHQIDEVLSQIGQHTNKIDWFIFPNCQPTDLGDRLVARGETGGPNGEWMLHGNIGVEPGTWMWIDLSTAAEKPAVPADFHVKQVTDHAMFEEWATINAMGFGSEDFSLFRAAYTRHGFGADAQAVHFIGYSGDQPVTSSTLLMAGGSASVYNVSTPTDLRRQGFGGAITHATLQHAQEHGYRASWIWSSDLGKSVYAKLGFVIADFGIREYQWKKRK